MRGSKKVSMWAYIWSQRWLLFIGVSWNEVGPGCPLACDLLPARPRNSSAHTGIVHKHMGLLYQRETCHLLITVCTCVWSQRSNRWWQVQPNHRGSFCQPYFNMHMRSFILSLRVLFSVSHSCSQINTQILQGATSRIHSRTFAQPQTWISEDRLHMSLSHHAHRRTSFTPLLSFHHSPVHFLSVPHFRRLCLSLSSLSKVTLWQDCWHVSQNSILNSGTFQQLPLYNHGTDKPTHMRRNICLPHTSSMKHLCKLQESVQTFRDFSNAIAKILVFPTILYHLLLVKQSDLV